MARDPGASQAFYGAVLGWQFGAARLGEGFTVGFSDGVPVAGIGALPPAVTVPAAWTPYFAVDDADVTAARIRERSGTVAVGPLAFGTGRAALASDRDGAVFGIWQGDAIPDWGMGGEAAPAWLELRTRDAFDAAIFYGEVLEWACGQTGCCEVAYVEENNRIQLRHAGRTVARLHGGSLAATPDPALRPRWPRPLPRARRGDRGEGGHRPGRQHRLRDPSRDRPRGRLRSLPARGHPARPRRRPVRHRRPGRPRPLLTGRQPGGNRPDRPA